VRLSTIRADGSLASTSRVLAVDAVCIGGGLAPLADLVRIMGCPVVEVPELGGTVPLHGPALETRMPGVFVAGNLIGIEGAPVAAAQGRLAAQGALRFLGVISGPEADRAIANAMNGVQSARRSLAFRFLSGIEEGHDRIDRLWRDEPVTAAPRLFPSRPPVQSPLIVCRCEEVSIETLIAAMDDGATAVAGVKKRTRACMGRCQGRVCEDAVRRIAGSMGHAELLRHRSRIPVRPVRMGDF
jgi:hypothetical protein